MRFLFAYIQNAFDQKYPPQCESTEQCLFRGPFNLDEQKRKAINAAHRI
uniref:Uncharacterized protein n=1 Tax=Anguilla anguilla TaxID=7936 RepID=A0A0E9SP88_ANGAN